jgi:hypothetical protein
VLRRKLLLIIIVAEQIITYLLGSKTYTNGGCDTGGWHIGGDYTVHGYLGCPIGAGKSVSNTELWLFYAVCLLTLITVLIFISKS